MRFLTAVIIAIGMLQFSMALKIDSELLKVNREDRRDKNRDTPDSPPAIG